MMHAWYPFSTAMSEAIRATTVLPHPTSPCTSRFMGRSAVMSFLISAITRSWAAVSLIGKVLSERRLKSGERFERDPLLFNDHSPLSERKTQLEREQLLEA